MQLRSDKRFSFYSLNEYALTIEFGQTINQDILGQIIRFNTILHRNPFDGFHTAVPAYTTLSVFFDPLQVIRSSQLRGINCYERITGYLTALGEQWDRDIIPPTEPITIPVCYGGAFGPDLETVAGLHGLTAGEVIRLHSTAIYHVHMIGFIPGFAYLGGMPEQLATPRRTNPRTAVPAGSIGIAGQQTGIYPLESPGGWQIIGRTPFHLFDIDRKQPALLKAGDQVIFKAVEICR